MLNKEPSDRRSHKLIARKLTNDPRHFPMSLGCHSCVHLRDCGGLSVEENIVDCLDLCCGNPDGCSLVCRHKPEKFTQQIREIGGLGLDNVERTPTFSSQLDADIVPLIYHGSRRAKALSHGVLALRLPDLVNYRTGQLRFQSRTELCRAFRIDDAATLILTGVNHDFRIEPWWDLGEKRLPLIDKMIEMGIALVTAPNFSVVLDHPRTDDLHAMKRIAIVFAEFQARGLLCALHPNGRTDRDFERWAEFVRQREEVQLLAYEFITGPGTKGRKSYHLEKLAMIAKAAGRSLDIVIRGKPDVIPFLRQHFRRVIYLEAGAFMKTINRQYAVRSGNRGLSWRLASTEPGTPIDVLFEHNVRERVDYLSSRYYVDPDPSPVSRAA